MPRVAIIAGDGIGQDVTAEAVKVLRAVGMVYGRAIDLEPLPYGADYYLATGITMPPGGFDMLRSEFDAIFIGALGDPRVPDLRHARDILLGIRFELDLYVNHRPVRLLDERLCPLKQTLPRDIDFVVFRENTEGLYANVGGRFKAGTTDEVAVQEEINTYKGVHRIIRHAFEFARTRGLSRVCMSDKSNAMPHGHALWQRVFKEVAAEFPAIEARHLYVDALAMFLIKDPSQFQVIVTNNLFGDIITDIAAAVSGGIGLAASGNIDATGANPSMFEPVHGSAPDIAGQGKADPTAAILSTALLLQHLGEDDAAARIEKAVADDLAERSGPVNTSEVGKRIRQRLS